MDGRFRIGKLLLAALILLVLVPLTASGERVLLLGVDQRPEDIGRSDTMMVISPRPFHGGLKLLSIPRDTRTVIPDHGLHKINAAYPLGGTHLAKDAASDLLDLEIRHFVRVDFTGVEAVVNTLGGVPVELDERVAQRLELSPGEHLLDGGQALEFIRFRGDPDADISRVARQRRFVRALVTELMRPANWPHLPMVYATFRDHSETSMSDLRVLRFAAATGLSMALGVDDETLPGRAANIGGISYWLHDEEASALAVDRLFGPGLSLPSFGVPADED